VAKGERVGKRGPSPRKINGEEGNNTQFKGSSHSLRGVKNQGRPTHPGSLDTGAPNSGDGCDRTFLAFRSVGGGQVGDMFELQGRKSLDPARLMIQNYRGGGKRNNILTREGRNPWNFFLPP